MRAERLKFFLSLLLFALAAVVIGTHDPSRWPEGVGCSFYRFTGLYCPGCGATRAVYQLLHGHWGRAFSLNPFMMLVLPFLSYAYVSYGIQVVWGRALPKVFLPARMIYLLLFFILAFTLARNIPYGFFSILSP